MKSGIIFATAMLVATAISAGSAHAGCAYGTKNLGGSLGPGQSDNSRSFTINDSANFRIQVQTGGVLSADLGCGWRTGRSHSCRRYGYGEQFVSLQNNSGRTVTYRWICRH